MTHRAGTFCTAINCMDGRTQAPVIAYLKKYFNADYVDMITEAGPNRLLAEGKNTAAVNSITNRVSTSVDLHFSVGIAVVGHHDCAGNPTPREQQTADTASAVRHMRSAFPQQTVIGLWVNENMQVEQLPEDAL